VRHAGFGNGQDRRKEISVMKLENVMERVGDAVSGRRVFAKPVEAGGVTVIPAAVVMGGGGAGGSNGAGPEVNEGGGLGLYAFPVGAYVVRDGRVRWKPAVDVGWVMVFTLMALRIVLRHLRETGS
jgi:uncharacterized spore protein YtfJ